MPQDILPDAQIAVEFFLENLPPDSTDPESAPAAHQAGHQLATPKSARARLRIGGRRTIFVGIGLVAAVIGWTVLNPWTKDDHDPRMAKAPVQQRTLPGWAAELDGTFWEGWMKIQSRFGLQDATIRSAIRILKGDDKYPLAHWLRDLTAYPAQVERAFAILAGSEKGMPRSLGALVKDLEMRLVSASKFPDEPAGERHLGGSRALEDNTVVLAVLDLLGRHEHEVAVKDLLAAVRQRGK